MERTIEIADTCPRRMQEIGPWEKGPDLDGWLRYDVGDELHCAFCGSLEPEFVLHSMATGQCVLGPTDKSYKVYVVVPETALHGKFYFQHFNDAQQQRFIWLLNERPRPFKMETNFYVLPFFIEMG